MPCVIFQAASRQVRTEKYNKLLIISALFSLEPETRESHAENTGCNLQNCDQVEEAEGQRHGKMSQSFHILFKLLSLIQHSFIYYKPLIVFQSSNNVCSDSFYLFFQCPCGHYSCLLYHLAVVTPKELSYLCHTLTYSQLRCLLPNVSKTEFMVFPYLLLSAGFPT